MGGITRSRPVSVAIEQARSVRALLPIPTRFPEPAANPAERRRRFEQDGFVLGERLLAEHELRRLRSEFDRLYALSQQPDADVRCRSVETGATSYHCVYNMGRHSDAFAEVLQHRGLLTQLEQLTGRDTFRLVLDQVQFKPRRVGGQNGWHRDLPTYAALDPFLGLTAWIALDDATAQSGCMRMVPGSHAWGDADDVATDWGIELPDVYRGHTVQRVLCPVPAGSVHFHNERVWHGSVRNRSRAPRRALAIHLIEPEARHSADVLSEYSELPRGAPLADVLPVVVGGSRSARADQ